ncbi:s-norcoclaurine synthase 1 [Quercus suber]|uniref:S-norcoclaurine synthase 1 n=1 Tax=Quercus suber TaxID=58331 RepID=A0AAW0L9K6_QUESU
MSGQLSHELEVNVPASDAWELYDRLGLAKLVVEDGNGFSVQREKFTKYDNEKRMKELEVMEGGYLDLGLTLFRVRFEIIEKNNDSCIIKSTIEYDIKEEVVANTSYVTTDLVAKIAEIAKKYLIKNKATKNAK